MSFIVRNNQLIMSDVAKEDGAMSNCVAVKTNSDKLPNENCQKDGITKASGGFTKDVDDLDEGELGGLVIFHHKTLVYTTFCSKTDF